MSYPDTVDLLPEASLRQALEKLKAEGFNLLVDLTCVDFLGYGKGTQHASPAPEGRRFKLTYRLLSLDEGTGLVRARAALEAWVESEKGPPSIRDLWLNADWLEREVWDMFGISFQREGIKRILMYEEFIGHPLRKDYPIDKRQPLIGPKDAPSRERMTEGDLRPRITD